MGDTPIIRKRQLSGAEWDAQALLAPLSNEGPDTVNFNVVNISVSTVNFRVSTVNLKHFGKSPKKITNLGMLRF